ncbi:hypothetical protein TNCV_1747181 [Trichonephila clavipes]|nr:hypothetical protein TNCV_1747181 [Trichonephila clavipes]
MSQILQTLSFLDCEHGFTLDFNKNELRSIHEEVTIFKIKHRTESIRQKEVNYLGIISAECSYGPEKVSAVKNWKHPENLRELASWDYVLITESVKGFSNIARPLHKLTESKQKFQWTKE